MLGSGALGLSLTGASAIGNEVNFTDLFLAIMVYIPATWVMLSTAILFVGLGRLKGLAWLYLGFAFVIIYFGDLLNFADWVKKLSPFEHISNVPVDEFNVGSSTILTIIAGCLMMLGIYFYRRRDVKG